MAIPTSMDVILSEVNFDSSKIYIIQCIGAHNEEEWIEYPIKSIYGEVDKIIVVEGAVQGRPESTEDGHSIDGTFEKVKTFPDPDNKIELITKDGHWASLEEQKQVFLDRAREIQERNPDLMIFLAINDCDEIYTPKDIQRFRKAVELRPYATEFVPTFIHFWRDFSHCRTPSEEWNITHQRFFRYQIGMKYNAHPVVADAQGMDTCLSGPYQQFRFQIPNLYIYHYGAAKPLDFQKKKLKFYQKELAKHGKDAVEDAERKYDEMVSYTERDEDVLLFTGNHPEVMKEHSRFKHVDENLSKRILMPWHESKFYDGRPIPVVFNYGYFKDESLWQINPIEV